MPKWEIRIERKREQTLGKTRTVGTYQVYHDGEKATGTIRVGEVDVPLFGTTAEAGGPSQNDKTAEEGFPTRIVAKTYPMQTSGGPTYVTHGYRQDVAKVAKMPGLELTDTGRRSAILIHPGKDEFRSTVGCINLCTHLDTPEEIIGYKGSRRRVIALIEDMKQFLGNVPTAGDRPIPNAFVVIGETQLAGAEAAPARPAALAANATYSVQRDDSLGKIARRFGTSWQVLKALNGLANANQIFPGQVLKLPAATDGTHPGLAKPATSAGKVGPVTTKLPASGPGFVIYNPDDAQGSDRYGTAGFVAALQELARKWSSTETVPISFGDMNRKNGAPFPPHNGHRTGREVDIRPFRKDGRNLPATWRLAEYDRPTTRRFIQLVKQLEPNAVVFFNDPELIEARLARGLRGHDNHLHLQIYD
jgi:LysM repeat protein